MNTTKLTLSAEKSVIRKAKKIAEKKKTSVSALFSRYVEAMYREESEAEEKTGPLTREASGLVKLRGKKAAKEVLADALTERYDAKR